MCYNNLKNYLLNNFENNDFINLWKQRKINQNSIEVHNNFNLNLSVAFPGYKTDYKYNHIVYDYRVDLNRIAISHANIVTDIYNKCVQAPHLIHDIYNFLIDLAYNGLNVNLNRYPQLLNYRFQPPNNELLTEVENGHNGKYYNRLANSWNYSFEELSSIIPYIVLQEDINYPMPRFSGRRMSFYRYVEAIFCSLNNQYSIRHAINRTLSHSRPQLWMEFNDYYQPITNIVNL